MDQRYWRHPMPFVIAIVMVGFYFKLPDIVKWISLNSGAISYRPVAFKFLISDIQRCLVYPFGDMLDYGQRSFLVIFYWLIIGILVRILHVHTGQFWKYIGMLGLVVLLGMYILPNTLLQLDNDVESIAVGHADNGYMEDGKRMPFYGANFSTYSFLGYLLGRTFVHSKVRNIIIEAYKKCETTCPEVSFVLGEISQKNGGHLIAHQGHQNGLSVDFLVPLLKEGKPYQASRHLLNLWSYAIDFDMEGSYKGLEIDFESMARHILALEKAAYNEGMVIKKIVFDPVLKFYLMKGTSVGEEIQHLPFSENSEASNVDAYYHVDFAIKQISKE